MVASHTYILALLVFLPTCMAANITVDMKGDPLCFDKKSVHNCTLDAGLSAAQTLIGPVTIAIQPGNYTLHNNTSCMYHNRSGIQIVGQDSPVVNCLPGTGCSFYECQNINVDDVTFIGCGAVHNSTSTNFTDNNYSVMKYQVAIYFEQCYDITMVRINITNSEGMGLVFINSPHHISITDSWFINNTVGKETAGGGGMYIEFSNISSGIPCSNEYNAFSNYTSNGVYELTKCHFIKNSASNGGIVSSKTKRRHYIFGRGGGLLLYFEGNAKNNNIIITSCEFRENQANLGAGIFAKFGGKSENNFLNITITNFTCNKCYKANVIPNSLIAGGGAKINFGIDSKGNRFLAHHSYFTNNTATWGGGLSVHSRARGTPQDNSVQLNICHFESNIAKTGAAVNFLHYSKRESSVMVIVENCTFTENGGLYRYVDGYEAATFGTMSVEQMPVTFQGEILFDKNKGSALLIQSSDVNFINNASAYFESNVGRIGAAITLRGASWITVSNGTELVFSNNTATEKGGAIYAEQTKEYYATYSHMCFIAYVDSRISPNEWESSFTFKNNTASGKPNSIFASSILPCVWPTSLNSTLDYDISQTFCNWTNWEFTDGNCSNEVLTSAGRFSSSDGYTMTVYPGSKLNLNATVFDDFEHVVTKETIFSVSIHSDTTKVELQQYTSDSDTTITVYGHPDETANISIQTVDGRNIYTSIEIKLSPCPPGFKFENSSKSCECSLRSFAQNVYCIRQRAFIKVGYCISYSPVENGMRNETIVSYCPAALNYHQFENQTMPFMLALPQDVTALESDFCGWFNRTGKLCGECRAGYGVSMFSHTFKCVKCSNSYKNWLLYLTADFFLPTFVFVFIIIFHIGITLAPANGFIFFSQVITTPKQVLLVNAAWKLTNTAMKIHLADILLHPYRVWSLDFSSILRYDFCFSENLKVIHTLLLRYVSAVLPLLLLIIAYTIVELHARNCKIIVWLWKPCCLMCVRLRRKWEAKTSIIDAFATFILLSYTKFVRVSIEILRTSTVYNVSGHSIETVVTYNPSILLFHAAHAPYVAPAVFILATFGALPPLLLLLYPFRWFQRSLSHCKLQSHALRAFVDAFQGCYKDGRNGGPDRRYFAGIYFIFRIIIFIFYIIVPTLFSLFTLLSTSYIVFMLTIVILRPYKKEFYNCLDTFFFAILAVINTSSLFIYSKVFLGKRLPKTIIYLTYMLGFIPFLYILIYTTHYLLMQSSWLQKYWSKKMFLRRFKEDTLRNRLLLDEQPHIPMCTTSEIPDRLEHPDDYERESDTFEQSMPQWDRQDNHGTAAIS